MLGNTASGSVSENIRIVHLYQGTVLPFLSTASISKSRASHTFAVNGVNFTSK
ncbi:MAG: hypothetical protein Q8S84_00820 [bacterium]|nr:hypothetical protein [bacterium]